MGRLLAKQKCNGGFTLVEVMVASAIGAMLAIGLSSLTVMANRMAKGIFSQQMTLYRAKSAMEALNREARMATVRRPIRVLNEGSRVEFFRAEDANSRSFEIISQDDDIQTPWDNTLVFDPDNSVSGDEQPVCTYIAPSSGSPAFAYTGATSPLVVRMRVGDPLDAAQLRDSNRYTGPSVQGTEINMTVSPRN